MYENGCYSSPLSELGYLPVRVVSGARLVMDTGIHFKKWTRDEAIEYLWKTTGLKQDYEIDRYIVWPGQALAYKIGELKILELREMASTGTVLLDILEQEVIRYIEDKKNISLLIDSTQGKKVYLPID